jgi:hypothetical protein
MLKWSLVSGNGPNGHSTAATQTPTVKTSFKDLIYLISKLSERFRDLGRSEDAQEAIKLLAKNQTKKSQW